MRYSLPLFLVDGIGFLLTNAKLRRSAMDFALSEISDLRGRLGASDRDRLDSYQESLRDIENLVAKAHA